MVEDLIGKGKAAGLESRAEEFIHSATGSREGFCAGADLIQMGKQEQVEAARVQGEPGREEEGKEQPQLHSQLGFHAETDGQGPWYPRLRGHSWGFAVTC